MTDTVTSQNIELSFWDSLYERIRSDKFYDEWFLYTPVLP
jgi:hypothetical protein